LILDERKVIGLIAQEDCKTGFFKDYEPLRAEDCTLSVRRSEKEDKKCTELLVGHPDIKYYISPQLLSRVYEFLSIHFNEVHVYGVKKKPFPFLLRATELGKDYDGCAFLVAPVVFYLNANMEKNWTPKEITLPWFPRFL